MGIGASRSRSGEEGVALTLSTMSAKEMFHNLYLPAEGYPRGIGPIYSVALLGKQQWALPASPRLVSGARRYS